MGLYDYVNADEIARGISPYHPDSVAFEAGRVMLERLNHLASERHDFAFETTLSGKTYIKWISRLRSAGYMAHLVLIALNGPELAIERVANRVKLGGHNIPTDVIRRRWQLGLQNFFHLYSPLVDTWSLYDNSEGGKPRLVAVGRRQCQPDVVESRMWQELCRLSDVDD